LSGCSQRDTLLRGVHRRANAAGKRQSRNRPPHPRARSGDQPRPVSTAQARELAAQRFIGGSLRSEVSRTFCTRRLARLLLRRTSLGGKLVLILRLVGLTTLQAAEDAPRPQVYDHQVYGHVVKSDFRAKPSDLASDFQKKITNILSRYLKTKL
jgi:hypothetical protein